MKIRLRLLALECFCVDRLLVMLSSVLFSLLPKYDCVHGVGGYTSVMRINFHFGLLFDAFIFLFLSIGPRAYNVTCTLPSDSDFACEVSLPVANNILLLASRQQKLPLIRYYLKENCMKTSLCFSSVFFWPGSAQLPAPKGN